MSVKVYASRSLSAFNAFDACNGVREHGGFYVATVPDKLPGVFEIVANVDASTIVIEHNRTALDYNDMTDLIEWAFDTYNAENASFLTH